MPAEADRTMSSPVQIRAVGDPPHTVSHESFAARYPGPRPSPPRSPTVAACVAPQKTPVAATLPPSVAFDSSFATRAFVSANEALSFDAESGSPGAKVVGDAVTTVENATTIAT